MSASGDDHRVVERAYVEDLVAHVDAHGAECGLRLITHSVQGTWPETELWLVIVVAGSAARYGVRDNIWSENAISEIGPERAATYTWLRLKEMAETRDVPPPSPDADGITWVPLWPD